jgi:hypothetical protein
MIAIRTHSADPALLSQWGKQIGGQGRRRSRRGPRPFAALTFYTCRAPVDGLVELRHFRLCLLQDISIASSFVGHRLAIYRAKRIPWGVLLGGAAQICCEKDLGLMPGRSSQWRRIAGNDRDLLTLGLHLDDYLERHSRYPFFPRRNAPRLPQFWAVLDSLVPRGEGPEFEAYCGNTKLAPDAAILQARRQHLCHWMYPLEFVSHEWQRFGGIYIDLRSVSKHQVIRLDCGDSLSGYRGACQFDFVRSRFAGQPW